MVVPGRLNTTNMLEQPITKNNVTNYNTNKKTKKKKTNPWCVDHWQFKSASTFESAEEFNRSPLNNFESRAMKNNNRMRKTPANSCAGKKRKASGTLGGPEKKKTKKHQFSGKGKRKEIRHKTICKFFLEGKCNKGNECTFLHIGVPARKQHLCKFYLIGFCTKGDECLFMHKEFPCKFFHTGAKCYSQEQCKFSHEPLSDEMKSVLAKYLDSNKKVDLHPPSPRRSEQSLLGSPPHHNNSDLCKNPSLFDIQMGTPTLTSTTPMPNPLDGTPVRLNFYSETLQSPLKERETKKGKTRSPTPELPFVDANYVIQPYKLRAMALSLPNYAHVLASTACKTDARVLNDPRLKKENHKKADESEPKPTPTQLDKPFLLCPTDPRFGRNTVVTKRHCGLSSVRERTPYLVANGEGTKTKWFNQSKSTGGAVVDNSSLKDVFKTIDPTASPFC